MTTVRDWAWGTHRRPTEPPVMRRPAVYLVAAATVLALGANWPIMAAGVELVPPLWLAAMRVAGAAAVVAIVLGLARGMQRPARQDRPVVLSVGLAHLALVTGLVFLALEIVAPGRSAIVVYTSALWAVPMAAVVLHEHPTSRRIAGVALGCAGLVLLLEPWSLAWRDARTIAGIAMLLLAALANAGTSVHVRAHRWAGSPLALMPWQLIVAATPLTLLAWAIEGPPRVPWEPTTIAIVAYQVVLGSAFGLWGLLTVGRSMPAVTTNLAFMAVPVVGLATSVAFTEEQLTVTVIAALVLVLVGVGIGLWSDRTTVPQVTATP